MRDCVCGSGAAFDQCCGPLLDGEPAQSVEALMRSRYAAFATGNEDHIFRTWHPRTRPPGPYVDPDIEWRGLEILSATGTQEAEEGVVEFIASWRRTSDGADGQVRERSTFTRRAGRWFYLSGENL